MFPAVAFQKVLCPCSLAFAIMLHYQIFLEDLPSEEDNINTKRNTIDGQMLA
jgi:hypothetical protein